MQKSVAVTGALVVAFVVGLSAPGIFGWTGANDADTDTDDSPWALPVAAQKAWFPPVSDYETDGEALDDAKFEALMTALDEAMTAEETLADFNREAEVHLMNFVRRLAPSLVSDEQKERIQARFAALAEEHPDHSRLIEQRARLIDGYSNAMGSLPSLSGSLLIFGDADEYDTGGAFFEDAQIDDMLARIDAAMNIPETLANFEREAGTHFWRFGNRLQQGRLTPGQVERVAAFYEGVKAEHPRRRRDDRPAQVRRRQPDSRQRRAQHHRQGHRRRRVLAGGIPRQHRGADLHGSVVRAVPRRVPLPPVRAGELRRPADRPARNQQRREARDGPAAKIDENLPYRTWWDGHSQPDADVVAAEGPIATAWNVTGWPTIYILDDEGVIRFVGRRGGEFIAALDELYTEIRMRSMISVPQGIVIPASRPQPAQKVG